MTDCMYVLRWVKYMVGNYIGCVTCVVKMKLYHPSLFIIQPSDIIYPLYLL